MAEIHSTKKTANGRTDFQLYIVEKKGAKTDPANYHPVSLTSVACKSMEHTLVSQVMQHLTTNNILSDNQFGFRLKHSIHVNLNFW